MKPVKPEPFHKPWRPHHHKPWAIDWEKPWMKDDNQMVKIKYMCVSTEN